MLKLFLLIFISFGALAGELYYLTPESIDLKEIPTPPVPGSQEDQVDLQMVLVRQSVRTTEDCKQAAFEAHGFATSFFGAPYGPLSTKEAEKLVEFQERLFDEVNYFSRILKQNYKRERPFDRDSRVTPCIPLHHSNSYPSGHAAIAYVAARTFSMIYPKKEMEFLLRASDIAKGRVIGGVHHPTDVAAGQILGRKIFDALKNNPEFLKDVEELAK